MKKVLSLVTTLAVLAGTASAAPYVLPSPQTGALTPYDMQPHYGIDAVYGINDRSAGPNMYGVRGSFNLYSSGADAVRHQFSVNVAGMMGHKHKLCAMDEATVKTRAYTMPITAGYDLNVEVTDGALLYVGGKAGYAFNKVTTRHGYDRNTDSKGGFTFSVGGGLKFECSDAVMIKVGYEFSRTYVDTSYTKSSFGLHSIILGTSVQF